MILKVEMSEKDLGAVRDHAQAQQATLNQAVLGLINTGLAQRAIRHERLAGPSGLGERRFITIAVSRDMEDAAMSYAQATGQDLNSVWEDLVHGGVRAVIETGDIPLAWPTDAGSAGRELSAAHGSVVAEPQARASHEPPVYKAKSDNPNVFVRVDPPGTPAGPVITDTIQRPREIPFRPQGLLVKDLESLFPLPTLDPGQAQSYDTLCVAARTFVHTIVECTPVGPDQTVAIRHVRDAVMTAHAAIALRGRC